MSDMNSLLFILPSFLIFKHLTVQEILTGIDVVKKTVRWSDMPSFTEWETELTWNLLVHRTSRVCPCMCVG